MKSLVLALSVIMSLSLSANVQHSELETRHANLMEKALDNACGSFRNLEVVSVEVEEIRVDQGITDKKFTTILTGEQRMDQNIFDQYIIQIESSYSDSYDHENKDWGAYSVESVKCVMK